MNGIPCTEKVYLVSLCITTIGTHPVDVHFYKNATLGAGTQTDYESYKEIIPNSITLYDTTSQTKSGGLRIKELCIQANGCVNYQFNEKIYIQSLENLVVTVSSGGNSEVHMSFVISEDV
jgi:hypothetical protein